jgi:hypothetical protein
MRVRRAGVYTRCVPSWRAAGVNRSVLFDPQYYHPPAGLHRPLTIGFLFDSGLLAAISVPGEENGRVDH